VFHIAFDTIESAKIGSPNWLWLKFRFSDHFSCFGRVRDPCEIFLPFRHFCVTLRQFGVRVVYILFSLRLSFIKSLLKPSGSFLLFPAGFGGIMRRILEFFLRFPHLLRVHRTTRFCRRQSGFLQHRRRASYHFVWATLHLGL